MKYIGIYSKENTTYFVSLTKPKLSFKRTITIQKIESNLLNAIPQYFDLIVDSKKPHQIGLVLPNELFSIHCFELDKHHKDFVETSLRIAIGKVNPMDLNLMQIEYCRVGATKQYLVCLIKKDQLQDYTDNFQRQNLRMLIPEVIVFYNAMTAKYKAKMEVLNNAFCNTNIETIQYHLKQSVEPLDLWQQPPLHTLDKPKQMIDEYSFMIAYAAVLQLMHAIY